MITAAWIQIALVKEWMWHGRKKTIAFFLAAKTLRQQSTLYRSPVLTAVTHAGEVQV